MQIGTSHPAVRQVLALQRNQASDDENLTLAEGLWACQSVLDSGLRVPLFLWCPDALRGPEAAELAAKMADLAEESYQISARTLDRLADRDKPDGLISVVEMASWQPADLALDASALVLVADGIEQPGNLGTLVRTLDACGADALIMTNTRTKRTNVKVFRASHGTILRIPTVSFDSILQAQTWLDEHGFRVYLADTDGASRYSDANYGPRTAIVMGNERFGISPDWYTESAAKVFIPMLGVADSLNVSISAAVLLYEARSQLSHWR
ncbi:TrmH family RNA methyltransferase [Jatrophihabitans sp. DSM 45814]